MASDNNSNTDNEKQALDPFDVALDALRHGKYRESLGGVNPTGASALMKNERGEEVLVGKCLRQVWYSKKRVPRTNPANDNSQFIFMMGNMAEEGLQQAWTNAGVLLESNAKIRANIAKNPETDDEIMLSGEVDAIVRMAHDEVIDGVPRTVIDPSRAIGIEVKSKWGYGAKKVMQGSKDSTYEHGFPQIEHLMQTALYLHTRKAFEDFHNVEIPYFVICYIGRDNGLHKSFRVELSDGYEGRIIVKDMNGNEIKPKVEKSLDWGVQARPIELTIDMMRERYLQQIENLKSDTPPAREFDLRYSDEKAERLFNAGELSKTKFNEHGKKPLAEIGDWNCSYCDWKGVCYPQGIFTIDVEDGKLTIDEALANYSVGE
jgi:hypothetical protein|tara:strand:+ start:3694 stop:4818 length:1125 start_codon:yes stop_codon:yes gene_type:complete